MVSLTWLNGFTVTKVSSDPTLIKLLWAVVEQEVCTIDVQLLDLQQLRDTIRAIWHNVCLAFRCALGNNIFFTQQETWKSNYQGLAVHEAFATSFIIIQSAMLHFCCLLIKIQSVSKLDGTLSSWEGLPSLPRSCCWIIPGLKWPSHWSKQWGIVTVLKTQSVQLNRSSEQKAKL